MAYGYSFLYRWGPAPDQALDTAWDRIGRFFEIDGSDPNAYSQRGLIGHFRGDHDDAIADMRRAIELNPNYSRGLFLLAWAESSDGLTDEARAHVARGLRLSPRENEMYLGIAYLALTQASFADGDIAETRKWGRLSIRMHPRAPIRRTLMIACCAFDGDMAEAGEHRRFLESFSPDFLPSILDGKVTLYRSPDHNARLVEGVRNAGVAG